MDELELWDIYVITWTYSSFEKYPTEKIETFFKSLLPVFLENLDETRPTEILWVLKAFV